MQLSYERDRAGGGSPGPGDAKGNARQGRVFKGPKAEPDVTADPTPIRISRRTRTALLLAVLVLLAYVVYLVPDLLSTTIGGIALALVLSFPVRLLSRFVPRGIAILLSFLLVLILLAALFFVPFLVEQFASPVGAVPYVVGVAEQYLSDALNVLQNRVFCRAIRTGLPPGSGTI